MSDKKLLKFTNLILEAAKTGLISKVKGKVKGKAKFKKPTVKSRKTPLAKIIKK